jgi:predicted permease
MGAVAAVMSLMLALGYQPLPYRDPEQLVAVWERVQSGAPLAAISGPDLADFASATTGAFTALGGFVVPRFWLLDRRGAEQIVACYIEEDAFRELGVRLALGRGVRAGDLPAGSGATAPAWISDRLWRARYGGSPSVIGATIGLAQNAAGLNEKPYRVVGVLPPGVSIPNPFMSDATDVWFILSSDLKRQRSRDASLFFGLGRLRPGVGVAQAQAALTTVAERLGQHYPVDRRKFPVVQSLEAIAQGPARQTMGLLALGAGLVFLLGCANLAILMVAEGGRRRRQIAIRAALGASRWRLWSEVAAEQCLLTLLSLGLGVALASALLRALAKLVPAAGIGPALPHAPPLNVAVLLGSAIFALTAALAWSALLVAAADWRGSARALAADSGLGCAGLSDADRGAARWRLVLLAAQAGIGICLLAAAALATRTYATLSAANLGPEPRRTVLLSVSPRDSVVLSDPQAAAFNQEVLSRLGRLPGTRAIALAEMFPPPGFPTSFTKQGDAADAAREATSPIAVSDDYFHALGIPILFGRGFDDTDHSGGEPVAIINLEMAERNWAAPRQAAGAQVALGSRFQNHYRIIGVAANFTGYWAQKPVPTVYLPEAQSPSSGGEVILRTAASTDAVAALAKQALAGMATPAAISEVSTMHARWQATLTRPVARMAGMLLLALLGLGLSVQGVYAVAAATVAARGHELAVRSALGAPDGRLVWNVTRELVLAAAVGAGFGVAGALALQPVLEQWLGPMATRQAEPIAVAVVLLILAAAAGCYVPARAAARANPIDALRRS